MRTQIGGSYRDDNVALFRLKRYLLTQGIQVRHPLGWRIEFERGEARGYAAVDYAGPFSEVERDYYRCISDCTFHCVANTFAVGPPGHIGYNAAVEIALAMTLGKAIALTHAPALSTEIEPAILDIVRRNLDRLIIIPFEALMANDRRIWRPPQNPKGTYDISTVDKRAITRSIKGIFDSIR